MPKIKEFLEELGNDPGLFARYRDDPQGVAEEFGLGPGQIQAVTSHNLNRIRHSIELESGDQTGQLLRVVM